MNNLEKVIEIANRDYDGHFTLMKFTTNWRACYGTLVAEDELRLRGYIQQCVVGKDMDTCLENLLKKPISVYVMEDLSKGIYEGWL